MEGDWLTFVAVCMYAQVTHLNKQGYYQQGPPVAPPPVYQQQPPPRGGGRCIEGWYVLPIQHQISFPHPNKLKSRNSNVLR
jgi:hypothetical protein